MQVKINKDALLRHRFWIMVGVAMLLAFTGILYLQFTDAEDKRDDLKKKVVEGKGTNPLHNAATAAKQAEYAKKTMEQETRIWKAAFDAQKSEFKWAKKVEDDFDFYQGFFAVSVKVIGKPPGTVKEWPPESANVTHGIIRDGEENWFAMEGPDKIVRKFRRTPTSSFVSFTAADGKPGQVPFQDMCRGNNNQIGKLVAVTYQTGRYFGDPLTDREQQAFADTYAQQIREIIESVDPYTSKGTGLVQLRDWPYTSLMDDPNAPLPDKDKAFLRYVSAEWGVGKELSKEIWIAQENIWIQREIYRMIASANDSISKFEDKGIDATTKMRTFVNPYFEVRLALDPTKNNSLKFIIKNLTNRRQKLDLSFKVKLRGPNEPAESLYVSGNPLMPAGSKAVKQGETMVSDTLPLDFPMTAESPRKGIFGLTQELTYQNAAVKRIDFISIGSNDEKSGYSHSHRTFPDGLKSLEDANPVKTPIPVKLADPNDPGAGGGGGIGIKFGQGGLGGAGNKKPLEFDLWTERYLEPPDQTRRVPICVSLIIDQDHVDRVMTKFNNSKLRLLLTQALLNQYTGSVAPPAPAADPKDPQKVNPNPFGPGRPMYPMGPFGGIGPNPPGTGGGGGGDADNSMELVIYGVMTLYQRYPPRPPMPVADKKF